MTITRTPVSGNFTDFIYDWVRPLEGFRQRVYSDNRGIPTLGVGYALLIDQGTNSSVPWVPRGNLASDLAAINLSLTPGDYQLLADVANALNASNITLAKSLIPPAPNAETDAIAQLNNVFSFRLITSTDGRTLFDHVIPRIRASVRSRLGTSLFNALDGSEEMAALLSLAFTNPSLIGPHLSAALGVGNRAEAWYEIRYASNRDHDHASRRYAEAQLFGLYEPGTVDLAQAKQIYRTLELHRPEIDAYEMRFGSQIGVANTAFGLAGTDNEVTSLVNSLIPAENAIFDDLRNSYASLSTLDPNDYTSTDIYLDPGRDEWDPPGTVQTDHSAALIATQYDGSGNEIGFRDILIGEGGDDDLVGGKGDDILLGGTGNDKYYFWQGDGVDTIIDSDGLGEIFYDFSRLVIGLKQGADQWFSLDGLTKYNKSASGLDLEISFTNSPDDKIIIKNFNFQIASADYLGVRLIDAPITPVSEVRTFLGDKAVWDSDGDPTNGVQSQLDAFGNTILADGQDGRPDIDAPNQADFFYGSNANEVEKFVTGGGDDTVYADGPDSITSTLGGADHIETGAGRDIVASGAGDDWVEGGTEGDILAGNDGNDTLYAESSNGGPYSGGQVTTWSCVSRLTSSTSKSRGDAASSFSGK